MILSIICGTNKYGTTEYYIKMKKLGIDIAGKLNKRARLFIYAAVFSYLFKMFVALYTISVIKNN